MNHGGHGDMDMGNDQCSMNMLFTWSTKNLCLVFRQWRITGPISLLLSLVAVILLTAGYEAVREMTRRYETKGARAFVSGPTSARNINNEHIARRNKIVLAVLYGIQVFYSFFIMLLFMTYNGWVMIAVGIGAALGYLTFGAGSAAKSASCH
ncbi:copper transpport protein [Ophidiomyces ophidiicola]|uniref:Copper transpport protein n=1 Tax=Ophidiomyces ophidiicola TaxID=1387563 RepID=A0ACB8V388_9EURO|nr:copper transpport protein [Ophidiomyces ophidiicola]KAI1913149.1 copper transpport protein [Ophidiomyces ophidiicola]KAI1920635.1 copper transpport protein [Ophidiomyces ophidiicola]KAI1920708.1 copper transpport protein [Ophidiomyces ophidiicola]KAI1928561.1 copper transpport protein [Ophidiomyces ophidiicola]KAI1946153.1 copper transpport protein [Ophidiomyces ophidiicola]